MASDRSAYSGGNSELKSGRQIAQMGAVGRYLGAEGWVVVVSSRHTATVKYDACPWLVRRMAYCLGLQVLVRARPVRRIGCVMIVKGARRRLSPFEPERLLPLLTLLAVPDVG